MSFLKSSVLSNLQRSKKNTIVLQTCLKRLHTQTPNASSTAAIMPAVKEEFAQSQKTETIFSSYYNAGKIQNFHFLAMLYNNSYFQVLHYLQVHVKN